MSRSLGVLTIDLLLKTVGIQQGADKAQRELEKRAKEIERTAKRVGAAVGTALVAGGALVANQLKNTINQMDELSKAAQRASLPTEEFSKLAYAGELADVSIQDLQASLGRLAKAQADAEKSTSTQGRIFDALGISTKNAEGNLRSTYEVFLDFADAFQEYQGSPEIVAAGLNIFGRSFQNLIPLLKDGSEGLKAAGIEAEQLGLVLSTEAGQQAEQFNDDLTRLKSSLTGLWREVAAQVLPQLVQLSGEFVQAAKEGDVMKHAADGIAESLRALAQTASLFVNLLSKLGELREMLAAIEQAGQRFSLGKLAGIGDQVRSVLPDWLYQPLGGSGSPGAPVSRAPGREMDPSLGAPLSPAEMAARSARLRGISGAFGDAEKKGGGGKSKEQQEAEQLQKSYESLMASMRERIALFNAEGEAAKVAYDLENGQLKMLDAAKKQELITEAQRYDALVKRREADEAAYELAKQETDRLERQKEQAEGVLDAIRDETHLMGLSSDQQEIWNNLKWAGVEAESDLGRAIVQSTQDLQRQREAMGDQIQVMDGVRSSFTGLFQDIRQGESVIDSLKNAFDNLADAISNVVAQNIADSLFGKQGDVAGGSTEGWFSSLLGMFFGGGRASGGWSSPNSVYEVNERGLEMASVRGRDYLLTGNSPVEITPNHRLGSGGGASITQNFINPRMTNLQTDSQRAREEARKAQRAVARV
jgi:hypothetical protein